MTEQQTFTDAEYSARKRSGRREKFLTSMDKLVPWAELAQIIEPYYPAALRRFYCCFIADLSAVNPAV